MQIHCLPALWDTMKNYIYVAENDEEMVVVDPGEAAPILAHVSARPQKKLSAVLITHKHADHIDGLPALREARPNAPVYAPAACGIANSHAVEEGDAVAVLGEAARVVATPGHTLEHVCFVNDNFMFCGDTLFVGGCGRMFEGDAAQFYGSLSRLAAGNANAKIYCGHEYTVDNLRFAQAVEPNNDDIARALAAAKQKRENEEPTIPGVLAQELKTNPFLRADVAAVRAAAEAQAGRQLADGAAVFGALREWKNNFK